MAWITLAELKSNLRIEVSGNATLDAELQSAIDASLDFINKELNSAFDVGDDIPEGVKRAGLIVASQFIENKLTPNLEGARRLLSRYVDLKMPEET